MTERAIIILLGFGIQFCLNGQTPPPNGLVAEYFLNGNANDSSGNFNDGVANDTTLTLDRFGVANNAYHFNADVNSEIAIADSPSLDLGSQFSVSLWFKYDQPWTYHSESLVYQFQYPQNTGWEIGVNQDDSLYGAGNYGIYFQEGSTAAVDIVPYTFLTSWNQIVGVYDGSSVDLYINGVLMSQQADSTVGHAPVNLVIGGNSNPVSGAYNRDIDDVFIYNRTLSSQEILNLSDVPEPRSSTLLLVLLGLFFAGRSTNWFWSNQKKDRL
jgi:hypothetical protein